MGFEPTTTCLGSKDSTTELRPLTKRDPTLASNSSQGRLQLSVSGLNSTIANFLRPILRRLR